MTIKERFEAMKITGTKIMETLAVAKFAKSATVLSNSALALEWLVAES